jgi:hypothetical protein
MKCSLQNLCRVGLLLAFLFAPGRLSAQESQAAQPPPAAATQPPAIPELADLIPLATVLSGRLSSLEKRLADQGDRSQVERRLGEISATVDGYVGQFLTLKASTAPRAGRLLQFKADVESAGEALAGVNRTVTAKVRALGNLRKVWLAEQNQWNTWKAALLKDAPPEEITSTVTKAQGVIDTALSLLLQQLKPLLVVQEQVGTLQTRINMLTADVEGLISLTQGGVLFDVSPSMFSAQYAAQVAAALRDGVQTGLVQVSWPEKSFFAQQGWIIILQGVLSLVLALTFFRHRQQLEQAEHWRFVAKRPVLGLL